jgi:hypothetical protein
MHMCFKYWFVAAVIVTSAHAADSAIRYSIFAFSCESGYEITLNADESYEKRASCGSALAAPVIGKLPRGTYAKAVEVLGTNRFAELKLSYGEDKAECKRAFTDMEHVSISFRGKRVNHYRGCRGFVGEQRLRTIEERLEALFVDARKP